MTGRIDFFYDFRSPYSYFAFVQLARLKLSATLRPMQVLAVMEATGNVPTSITCAAKGRYSRIDAGRWARRLDLAFNPSNMRTNDGDACARAVLAADSAKDAAAITLALYKASWSDAQPLATHDEIFAALAAAGIDPAPVAARIDADDVGLKLDANTREAVERGVFGSPTMFVGDAMFFGNDRVDFVREEFARLEKIS